MTTANAACRVTYSGRVQAVGFRATAVSIARSHPVTGWVRNLPDGRVELHAEGERTQVAAFLDAITAYWGDYVTDEQRDWRAAEGTHVGFHVRR